MKWLKTMQWTENRISDQGYTNRETIDNHIARSMLYLTDPQKCERIKAKECILCFYTSYVSGQAFTEWNCRFCLKEQTQWSNTHPPSICKECSQNENICRQCGADVYLRVRRLKSYTT